MKCGLRTKDVGSKNGEEQVPEEILIGTKLMMDQLKVLFTFRFRAAEVSSIGEEPVSGGGVASDGSIVGGFTTQHWDYCVGGDE